MRLTAITPIRVADDELRRRQERYDRLAPPPLRVTLRNLDGGGVPRALNTAAEVRRSEELVAAAIRGLPPGSADVVMPDCVLDPAVGRPDVGAGGAPAQVVGMLRLVAGFLTSMDVGFSAVVRTVAIGDELAAKLRGYGLDQGFGRVAVLGVGFGAIAEGDAWATALRGAVAGLTDEGVTAVVNGCSAVDVDGNTGRGGVDVVDPTALALRLLAAWAGSRKTPTASTGSVGTTTRGDRPAPGRPVTAAGGQTTAASDRTAAASGQATTRDTLVTTRDARATTRDTGAATAGVQATADGHEALGGPVTAAGGQTTAGGAR